MTAHLPDNDAPLDWYLGMGLLTGAALLLVVAPEFVQSAIQGKLDIGLIGQGVQKRVEQVQGVVSPGANDFEVALKQTIKWEGTTCENHPDDIGGMTCKGILDSEYRAWRKVKGLAEQSVQQMTDAELKEIYRGYWDRCKAGDRPMPLSFAIFDTCVNFNEQKVQDWFQNLPSDPKEAAKTIMDHRIAYRHERVKELPSQQSFLQGWLNRDNDAKSFVEQYQGSAAPPQAQSPGDSPGKTSDATQAIARLDIGGEVCTGFFVSESELMTADHCFKAGQSGTVTMRDGKTATAQFKIKAGFDVAIAVVDGKFPYLPKGNPTNGAIEVKGYRLGQWTEGQGALTGRDSRGNLSFSLSPSVEGGFSGSPMLQNGQWVGVVVGADPNTAIPIDKIAY